MSDRQDLVLPFQVDGLGARGRLVRLGPAMRAAVVNHGYPDPVAALVGQAMVLAVTLASSLKYDGIFTLQTQSDGPVSVLVADVTSDGVVRGYARFDADRLDSDGWAMAPVPRLLGTGHMAFTVDQGPDTERYQGITALEGATLTDCANAYFRHSEQLATAVTLTSRPDGAAALMVQRLPAAGSDHVDRSDDDWRRAVILMSSATEDELLDGDLTAAALLFRLFHEDGVRVYDAKSVAHGCRCSRGKVERTLRSFPQQEIADMAEDGVVTVTCEFCGAGYPFDGAALEKLYAADNRD